jgi:tRNA (guanine-N(7)-)-methyltransferase
MTAKPHPAERLRQFADIVDVGEAAFRHRGRWADLFPNTDGRLVIEIGCFDGQLLATSAARWPTAGFVGIDWKAGSLADAAERVKAASITNVRLIRGRGQDLCRQFADGEVAQVWLFHPEPCDRPKEQSNRLMSPAFLADVHRVLRGGDSSRFILKTDHAEYYLHTLALLEDSRQFRIVHRSADYWNDKTAQDHAHAFAAEVTPYEARYRRKRLPIHYVELAKLA